MKKTDVLGYKNLLLVLKLMRVLSHGQANVERRFSVNNSVLKINMSEKSIISRKLIIDHMKSHDLLHVNFEESSQVCSIFSSTL